jgi:hypothetical protein
MIPEVAKLRISARDVIKRTAHKHVLDAKANLFQKRRVSCFVREG